MPKALSLSIDLRSRVLAAVAVGTTHREAASRFGVSAASVSRWRRPGAGKGLCASPTARRRSVLGADGGRRPIWRSSCLPRPGYLGGGAAWLREPGATTSATARCSASSPAAGSRAKEDRATRASRTAPMSRGGARPGSELSPTSIPRASSSSTRHAQRPIWPHPWPRAPRGERLRVGVLHGRWKTTSVVAAASPARHDRADQPRGFRGPCPTSAHARAPAQRHSSSWRTSRAKRGQWSSPSSGPPVPSEPRWVSRGLRRNRGRRGDREGLGLQRLNVRTREEAACRWAAIQGRRPQRPHAGGGGWRRGSGRALGRRGRRQVANEVAAEVDGENAFA